jgi:hypothetical protein
MADQCSICNTRRPVGGTKILVLNDGELWLEFCGGCGEDPCLSDTAEDGEEIWLTPNQVFSHVRASQTD